MSLPIAQVYMGNKNNQFAIVLTDTNSFKIELCRWLLKRHSFRGQIKPVSCSGLILFSHSPFTPPSYLHFALCFCGQGLTFQLGVSLGFGGPPRKFFEIEFLKHSILNFFSAKFAKEFWWMYSLKRQRDRVDRKCRFLLFVWSATKHRASKHGTTIISIKYTICSFKKVYRPLEIWMFIFWN